jgi:Family of unknown function (DUF6252)
LYKSKIPKPLKKRFSTNPVKMKRTIRVLTLAFFLFSCKKEITELPNVTQTGANTFGAKVNGEFWAPQGFGPLPANDILEAAALGDDIRINARNFASSPNETEFAFYIRNVLAPGTFSLNTDASHPTTSSSYGYYVKRRLTPISEWITSSSKTGTITITKIDRTAKIVSGTFEFTANPLVAGDAPLVVTEGRFDIKLL